MRYLSGFLVVKDENSYLLEWLTYHHLVGVEHFFIHDNDSKIPVSETLSRQIADGLVTVTRFPGEYPQMNAFADGLSRFGSESTWMAFIDTDEFIVSAKEDDFRNVLRKYEEFGGLALNWRLFGSSGHESRPSGLQIEQFTRRAPKTHDASKYVKWVIQPARFSVFTDPHHAKFRPGYFGVNEKKEVVRIGKTNHSSDEAWINHYFFRSRQEWAKKVERRSVYSEKANRPLNLFNISQKACNVERDEDIFRLLPRLKRELDLNEAEPFPHSTT